MKTAATQENHSTYVFEEFCLDTRKRLLFGPDGRPVSLMPKAFDILLYLLTNASRVVEKDELMSAIWPDTAVEENNLTQNISSIRKALGERHNENRFIATVPGKGYKFVAEIRESDRAEKDDETQGLGSPSGSGVKPFAINKRIVVILASVLVLSAVAYLAFEFWPAPVAPAQNISSIAVLPFKPIALDKRDESLEMGMADTLILKLSGVETLKVRPFTAVRKFAAPDQDALSAGRELGVEAVLDGRLQTANDRIRATVQLIRVADGEQIWTGQFDEKFTDIFALQDSIAQRVATQLSVTLGRRSSKNYTQSVASYQLYMRGNLHARRLIKPEIEKAIDYYHKAIEADPSFALAYIELANAHRALVLTSDESPLEQMPRAKAAALKAVELDPELAQAWTSLAISDFWYDWDWPVSEARHRRALELDPGNAQVRLFYAHLLSNIGRHDEAVSEIRRAREIDPASLITNAIEGQILFFAGNYDAAEEALERTIDLEPRFWLAHLFMVRVYLATGRIDDAIASAKRASELSGGNAEATATAAYCMALAGRSGEAAKVLKELLERSKSRYVPRYAIAQVKLALGDKAAAIDELEKAYEGRESLMVFLKVEPKWEPLRSDPRFAAILERMKF